jgi:hypothetical protein
VLPVLGSPFWYAVTTISLEAEDRGAGGVIIDRVCHPRG